jgi:hypothetical protein
LKFNVQYLYLSYKLSYGYLFLPFSHYSHPNAFILLFYVVILLPSLLPPSLSITLKHFRHIPFRAGHVARMGDKRNAYRVLMGNPEGKRPVGRPRRRWVDNIKMDLREIGWNGGDWIDLAQDMDQWRALVNAVMNLRVP